MSAALWTSGRPVALAVLVTDLDRTLTDLRLRPVPGAMAQVRRVRRLGVRTVLATGRRWEELSSPRRLAATFDQFILEGGAVTGRPGEFCVGPGERRTARLASRLRREGIPFRRGLASLSVAARHLPEILPAARQCGLQAVRNRDRVDVTARGVDKASALRQVRLRAGRRPGAALAFGDGENDVRLLAESDHAVAVANAVPRLKAVADEVTVEAGGHGIARFLSLRVRGAP